MSQRNALEFMEEYGIYAKKINGDVMMNDGEVNVLNEVKFHLTHVKHSRKHYDYSKN